MASYGSEYVKSKNRRLVLEYFARHPLASRAEIVQQCGISFPTVSKAVEYLLARGIVQETDQTETGSRDPGRKRKLLRFRPSACCALALHFEGQLAELGLVDLAGRLLCCETLPFPDFNDGAAIDALGERLAEAVRRAPGTVLGTGVAFPSEVDPDRAEIVDFESMGICGPTPFRQPFAALASRTAGPLFVENDVNMACLGEMFRRDSAGQPRDLCYLSLGTGFGAAIMLDGRLWRGAGSRAGEIGQTLCCCPACGDDAPQRLEQRLNIAAVDRRFGLHLLQDARLDGAQRDAVIRYLAPPLACSVYNLAHLLDIEQFILDGYLPRLLGQPLLDEVCRAASGLLAGSRRRVSVLPPQSPHTALLGGAGLVFERTLLSELTD